MNKAAIQRFAIWARKEMIAQVSQRAYQYGITAEGYGEENAVAMGGRVLSSDEQAQRRGLVAQIRQKGFPQVMEEVAYTWFNRFIALRFMEVNNYLPAHVRVFTDSEGAFKPEILTEALHLELPGLDQERVAGFIDKNQTDDLYRYLLLTQCNALNEALPRMFERMGSYTELLLPNNILRPDGILGRMIADIPEKDWTDQVQIIGWLYQYYNAELKDETFALLKKNVKVTKERIPSATQLFTPDWIVRYMVENSLGRLWIEGHPDAELRAGWKYYLDEAGQETEVEGQLKAIRAEYSKLRPQDIKVIDPCMGSGHILVYAFDVLVQIYKQTGVSERDAAQSILQNNLYGLDIDDRAAQLAYFAVMMKARQYDRRVLGRGIQPHLYSTASFEAGREYGSLFITDDPGEVPEIGQITLDDDERHVCHLLAQKYDVVVTNPPYLDLTNASSQLKQYLQIWYPGYGDLYSAFIERSMSLLKNYGILSMITMQGWMFSTGYDKARKNILGNTIISLIHLGSKAFDNDVGTIVQSASFVIRKQYSERYKARYYRLVNGNSSSEKESLLLESKGEFIRAQKDFMCLPSSPIAYWVTERVQNIFAKSQTLSSVISAKAGLSTGNNDIFCRQWYEVKFGDIKFNCSSISDSVASGMKWFPCSSGGDYRKWTAANRMIVNWENDGYEIRNYRNNKGNIGSAPRNSSYYFREGLMWNKISSRFAIMYKPTGFIFDDTSRSAYAINHADLWYVLGLLASSVSKYCLQAINQTFCFTNSDLMRLPFIFSDDWVHEIERIAESCIHLTKLDWDAFEISWDFQFHPMVPVCADDPDYAYSVKAFYNAWKQRCQDRFDKLKANEEELNRIFIDIYGLKDELTPEVEDKDVTVRLADLGRDVRSLISYAVGCMFGRYSANGPVGLIYAGGEWDPDRYGRFKPDADNIIPICDDEYFDDDIVGRFVQWLEVVFGKRSLEDNLNFIADALGGKGSPREVIRSYFLNDFYADHLKIYQKRPIYWLFDSGKKNGFKALVYMHRYQSDLLARMRTDYVHEQQERYRTQLRHIEDCMSDASTSERVKLSKQQVKLQEQALELQKYEEKIHHLADQNIQIDLDDGVKHNYALFSDVLAKLK